MPAAPAYSTGSRSPMCKRVFQNVQHVTAFAACPAMNEWYSHSPPGVLMSYGSAFSTDGRSREIVAYNAILNVLLLCQAERQPQPASRSLRLSLTMPDAIRTAEIGSRR